MKRLLVVLVPVLIALSASSASAYIQDGPCLLRAYVPNTTWNGGLYAQAHGRIDSCNTGEAPPPGYTGGAADQLTLEACLQYLSSTGWHNASGSGACITSPTAYDLPYVTRYSAYLPVNCGVSYRTWTWGHVYDDGVNYYKTYASRGGVFC